MKIRDIGPERAGQVLVGKVIKPHGIRGEIKIFSCSGQPDDFKHYREVILVDQATGNSRTYEVVRSSSRARVVVLKLAGLDGRSEAEVLRGLEVRVGREQMPSPGAGEFYWHDVEGLRVVTDTGHEVGTVTGLLGTPGHDILVVAGHDGREYLIPVREEFISHKDEEACALIITPPPGLLEMNA